jgi:RNA-directed DNA polymerase
MHKDSLYTDEIWNKFREKFGTTKEQFEIKKYPQLDPYFNFLKDHKKIQKLLADPTLKKVAEHSFVPFVKILTKTPRYRYQQEDAAYSLETKIRPISFASHFDTYIYGFYAFALTQKYQEYIRKEKFNDCVLAYRTDLDGKCNIQFAKEVFDAIREKTKYGKSCSVIALDITGYFDNIDHEILKEKWCKILGVTELPIDQYKVFRSLTKYNYINKDSILKHFKINLNQSPKWQSLLDLIPDTSAGKSFNEKLNLLRSRKLIITNLPKKTKDKETNEEKLEYRGIPQGSAMSALLSNIYLIDFDKWLYDLGKTKGFDFIYRRYCDDLIVICNPENVGLINNALLNKISQYKLTIQPKKTEILEFKKNSKWEIRSFNRKKLKDEGDPDVTKLNEKKFYKNLQYLGFEFNGQNIYIRPGSLSRYFRKMKGRIVKTVMMAYSKRSKDDNIKRHQIYEKYSYRGSRNFITYAQKAAKEYYLNGKGEKKEGMNSQSINRQISAHFRMIEFEILKTSIQRHTQISAKNADRLKKGKRTKEIPFKS